MPLGHEVAHGRQAPEPAGAYVAFGHAVQPGAAPIAGSCAVLEGGHTYATENVPAAHWPPHEAFVCEPATDTELHRPPPQGVHRKEPGSEKVAAGHAPQAAADVAPATFE